MASCNVSVRQEDRGRETESCAACDERRSRFEHEQVSEARQPFGEDGTTRVRDYADAVRRAVRERGGLSDPATCQDAAPWAPAAVHDVDGLRRHGDRGTGTRDLRMVTPVTAVGCPRMLFPVLGD